MSRYHRNTDRRQSRRKSPRKRRKRRMARRVIPIRGDGNCLFRSVSFCIYGTQDHHREIRLRVVDRIVDHWNRYKDFIIGDRSYGFNMYTANDYSRLMSTDGEYAGHVELHCVTELYPEYTFKIHRDTCPRTIDYGRGRYVKHLLFTGYLDAGHYSVLEYYWLFCVVEINIPTVALHRAVLLSIIVVCIVFWTILVVWDADYVWCRKLDGTGYPRIAVRSHAYLSSSCKCKSTHTFCVFLKIGTNVKWFFVLTRLKCSWK